MVKVSIVVPIYNVEKYLRQCLDSIVNQTLKNIEIICVNDGSKDSSLDIIMEYANKDSRIRVIDKENSGYGNSMNRGFDMATGEYIGIVESDDYVEPCMFEKLYTCAKENNLDVCKGGFYYYFSAPKERNIESHIGNSRVRKRVFCPTTDFKSLKEKIEFFSIKPTIWSAIYKNSFVKENNIRFNETAGASYQDASFNFKIWALAKRVKILSECLLHYRQDNEASSVNSNSKVFAVCDEYLEMERFLDEHPKEKEKLEVVKNRLKYDTYIWNYERLCEDKAKEFILVASAELKRDMQGGKCLKEAYTKYKWNNLNLIIESPEEFHRNRQNEKKDEKPYIEGEEQGGIIRRGFRSIRKNGLVYTIKRVFRKLKKR